ncbi:MAG TPA: biotin carboxylase N-terminal domain-containing protein [Candidatus Limnocylindrales bacterium]|nr:biotin carboxylase N-terminal domain-containing protein [Candidatus Limnocylindrales bacterium]
MRLFVANRGEIARRVFRTCREMGISTAAAFTEPELHCDEADVAVQVPSFLDGPALVRAAVEAGADAVHPGYGFLSENAAFARAVIDAGLTWIGPPPDAIEAMGSKIGAKKLMADAGVPVLTAVEGEFPLLVKASTGGGGRGLRVVRSADELDRALAEARSEAESAFGDPSVFTEPYVEDGRHIEVQVLADAHGRVWTLGERECSVQRRHQKVVEEAPSPMSTLDRAALFAAAASGAKAIGYVGAGTVEFLVDRRGRFFFLEMNTRLQVEHPVTELVYGIDLVRLQIEVARGATLGDPPSPSGHAIEARLYAEDPAAGWLPQSGTLHRFEFPDGVRVDSGVSDAAFVGVTFDPMLAKVIAFGQTRNEAARKLAAALPRAKVHGLRTNRDLLVRVLRHPVFLAGEATTAFLDDATLLTPLADEETVRLSAIAAARAIAAGHRDSGWRNVRSQPRLRKFLEAAVEFTPVKGDTPTRIVVREGALRRVFDVAIYGDVVEVDSALGPVTLHRVPRFPAPAVENAAGSLLAPMPATVVRLGVAVGDTVRKGQAVLWLEAMKMEHRIDAPADGVVTQLNASVNQQVQIGALLAVVEES